MSVEEATLIARGIASAVKPDTGLEPIQIGLMGSVIAALLDIQVDFGSLDPLEPDELAAALREDETADRYFLRATGSGAPLHLQVAWLDHLLATSRPGAVLDRVPPHEPVAALQIRRLIALRELGRDSETEDYRQFLDWEYQYALHAKEYIHAREIARFYLDVVPRPRLALRAAEHNLSRQREAEDYALYHRALAEVAQLIVF